MILIIAIIVGLLAGFLNAVASGGATVALPMLLFMGLSPIIASGTMRVPILVGCMAATITFIRAKLIDWPLAIRIVIPCLIGAILGVFVANIIDNGQLKLVIMFGVLIAIILLFTGIKKVIESTFDCEPRYKWQQILLLFLVGTWLGFIVIDGNIYLLLVLVLGMRLNFLQANAYKSLVLFPAILIGLIGFSIEGNIDWQLGSIMAVGSLIGGFLGAKLSMKQSAKYWAFRILVCFLTVEFINLIVNY